MDTANTEDQRTPHLNRKLDLTTHVRLNIGRHLTYSLWIAPSCNKIDTGSSTGLCRNEKSYDVPLNVTD